MTTTQYTVTCSTQFDGILWEEEFATRTEALAWAAESMEDMATNPDAEDYSTPEPLFLAAAEAFRNGTMSASVQAPGENETYTVTVTQI